MLDVLCVRFGLWELLIYRRLKWRALGFGRPLRAATATRWLMWRLLVWLTLRSNESRLSVGPLDPSILLRVSDYYSRYSELSKSASSPSGSLSLGDGLCIAVAERLELPITGGDLYWETLDLRVRVLSFR